jgi:antitoxin component YwqK of YwqJK toxin-antitoxin module
MNKLMLQVIVVCMTFLTSCQNVYRQNPPVQQSSQEMIGANGDSFQVTIEEYGNYFESRYGLLYQKLNDMPFTGRILIIEKGDSGEFVASDESWKEGRKDGPSVRWFSNGIKMYERNYKEGRWHGPVTRWWPNGQKMYVRAYTNGSRHGKEATWRSDGTPIKLADEPYLENNDIEKVAVDDESSVEEIISEPVTNEIPNFSETPSDNDSFPELPVSSESGDNSDFPSFPEPVEKVADEAPDFPSIETNALPSVETPEGLPPLPVSESSTNDLPAFPEAPSPTDSGLPPLPGADSGDSGFPALPPPSDSSAGDLPPLPGSPSGASDLPPLPGLPDAGGNDLPPLPPLSGDAELPPLPGGDGGLPPLPAFPE